MDFKVPDSPSRNSYVEEIADYWELQAAIHQERAISKVDIIKRMSVGSDELDHDGINSEEDKIDLKLDTVLPEFSKRLKACTEHKYPFILNRTSIQIDSRNNKFKYLYLFLLLSTRLKMTPSGDFNEINGPYLFEKLCRIAGENYFGCLSESFHFGTGNQGNFPDKVDSLIDQLEEGRGYRNINDHKNLKNDDGVDVVFWKNFSDKEVGKLIGFGQCKTGTSWQETYYKLKPKTFCQNWFQEHPVLAPIPIIFIADTLKSERNFRSVQSGYLFFNRFRIIEHLSEDLPDDIYESVEQWVDGALDHTIQSYT